MSTSPTSKDDAAIPATELGGESSEISVHVVDAVDAANLESADSEPANNAFEQAVFALAGAAETNVSKGSFELPVLESLDEAPKEASLPADPAPELAVAAVRLERSETTPTDAGDQEDEIGSSEIILSQPTLADLDADEEADVALAPPQAAETEGDASLAGSELAPIGAVAEALQSEPLQVEAAAVDQSAGGEAAIVFMETEVERAQVLTEDLASKGGTEGGDERTVITRLPPTLERTPAPVPVRLPPPAGFLGANDPASDITSRTGPMQIPPATDGPGLPTMLRRPALRPSVTRKTASALRKIANKRINLSVAQLLVTIASISALAGWVATREGRSQQRPPAGMASAPTAAPLAVPEVAKVVAAPAPIAPALTTAQTAGAALPAKPAPAAPAPAPTALEAAAPTTTTAVNSAPSPKPVEPAPIGSETTIPATASAPKMVPLPPEATSEAEVENETAPKALPSPVRRVAMVSRSKKLSTKAATQTAASVSAAKAGSARGRRRTSQAWVDPFAQ